jgi:2-methylcitrate dehydratase PrpD
MYETRTLAEWVTNLRMKDIPDTVKEHARRFLLDNFGCQIAGATLPWSRQFYDVIQRTRSGNHGTVAYYGTKLAPDDAAFINATFNHANETDDTHLKSPTHPGQIAVPCALAIAEYANATGEQLLLGVIAAYEVMIRLSWACSPYLIYRGHHPPVGVGPFGGATAGIAILGFNHETAMNAYGIAGSHAAGLIEYTKTGGSVKRIHAGIPSQGGVRSVLFAEAGITGPHSIIEGEKGFCKVFAIDYDLSRLTDGLGTKWHMLDNGIKPYSCCHLMHFAFDALDVLRGRQNFGPDEVKEVRIATNSQQILSHIGSITEPEDILGAQFSMPFSVAMRLHHGGRRLEGGNGFWDYVDVNLHDPALLETARKVKVMVASDQTRWSHVDEGGGVEVELKDGTVLDVEYPHCWGLPENPMFQSDVEEKFRYVTSPVMSEAHQNALIEAMREVDSIKSVSQISELLVVRPRLDTPIAAE